MAIRRFREQTGPLPYRIVVTDLDGTLLNDEGRVSDVDAAALRRFAAAGGVVVLATGRSASSALSLVEETGASWIVACNGAVVLEVGRPDPHFHAALPPDVAADILESVPRQGLSIRLYMDDFFVCEEDIEEYRRLARERHMRFRVVRPLSRAMEVLGLSPEKIGIVGLASVIEQVRELLASRFDGAFSMEKVFAFSGLELMAAGVDKGKGLRIVRQKLGVPKDRVMAIGDDANDVALFQEAGLRVAMANAFGELKRVADVETKANTDGGVAYAVENMAGLAGAR